MKPVQITFGGGTISPKLLAHLEKIAQPKSPTVPMQVGGGYISPSVARHLRQNAPSAK